MKTAPETCFCIFTEVWKPGIPGPTNLYKYKRTIWFNREDAEEACIRANMGVNPFLEWYEIEELPLIDRFFDGMETE